MRSHELRARAHFDASTKDPKRLARPAGTPRYLEHNKGDSAKKVHQDLKSDKHAPGAGHDKSKDKDKEKDKKAKDAEGKSKDKDKDKDKEKEKDAKGKDGKGKGDAGKGKGGGGAKGKGKGQGGGKGKGKEKKEEGKEGKDPESGGPEGKLSGGKTGGPVGQADLEFRAIPPIPMARTGDFYPPIVEDPPDFVIRQDASIVKDTGIPAREHHARIRRAVEAVTRACSEAQIDMVRRVNARAWEVRFEIEKLADQIPEIVEGGVAMVSAAVKQAKRDINTAAEDAKTDINSKQFGEKEDIADNRDKAMKDIATALKGTSQALKDFADGITAAFKAKMSEAAGYIRDIPNTGTAKEIAGLEFEKELAAKAAKAEAAKHPNREAPKPKKPHLKVMGDAEKEIADNLAGKGSQLTEYANSACAANLPGMIKNRQDGMVKAADARAKDLDSEVNLASFFTLSVGLINPAAGAAERDEPAIKLEEKRENEQETLKLMDAREQAVFQIGKTQEDADAYLKEKLKDWVEDLRNAGRKVRNALLNQSRAAEVGLATAAAQMADTYPDIVRRLQPVVAGGRWLDSRQVLPQLDEAQRGAQELHDQQLKAINDQAGETLEGARQGFEQQRKGLIEQAQKLTEGAYDVGTQIAFDLMLSAAKYTGKMGKGAEKVLDRARKYAERTAKDLLERTKRMKGKGVTPLEACAIRFLNQGIHGFEAEYHHVVATTEDEFETPQMGHQFPEVRKTVIEGVQKRADDCHAALPEPPGVWDYVKGAAVGTVLGGGVGGLAAVGYMLWESSPDEDKVFTALTGPGLPFPGTRVVAGVYDGDGSFSYKGMSGEFAKNYGNLEKHIKERLDNPEKQKALDLFDTDAAVRANAKNWIIKDSTKWFGVDRATGEAAAASLDAGERAALKKSGELDRTKELLKDELGKLDFQMNEAFLDGKEGKALAMKVEKKLVEAQEKGNADIVSITGDLENMARQQIGGTYGNAFMPPSHTEELVNDMFMEHAKAFSGEAGQKPNLTNEDARKLFSQHAQDMLLKNDVAFGGAKEAHERGQAAYGSFAWDKEHPEYAQKTEVPPTVTAARSAIEAQVMAAGSKDQEKQDAAFAARGAYEILEGERVGSGETTQTRINALEDREWNQMKQQYKNASPSDKAAMSKRYFEAKARHEKRMQMVMDKLPDNKKGMPKGGNAEDYVARRTGAVLAGETAGEAYGKEMIKEGRASITTSIRMATEKAGTHEELINHALEGRSEQEQKEEEQRFKKETGESIDSRLYGSGGWFGGGELSGDDAHRAKEIQAGSSGTDKAAFQQAFLQFQHQAVEGTGFIAEGTMAGSPEKRNLYKSRDQLARMLMQAAGKPNGDPSKVFDSRGKILPPYDQAFDKNGKLRRPVDKDGKPVGRMTDLNAMRSSMHLATTAVKTNADAYRAAIDRQEAFWTNLITALAIVVSIALMFIPGVNLLVAGIIVAVLAGAATMAVKAGFRGGRYGWEEAATDVGMTAIEAATAGIGGGMGRGAAAAEKAAMRGATLTAKEVSGTLAKVGAGLSNKLGRVGGAIAREAIVGAVGGAARTALNERTWKEGIGAGIEEMALGGLKGAAVSAVSAGVSQGIANKMNKSLAPALDPTRAGVGARVGEKLGEGGRQMLSAVASQTLGAMAATATDIIIDTARGRYEGGLKDALRAIGESGLRELFSSAGRTGAELRNKARYRALMAEARKAPPGSLTERDLKTLKLAAISAGEHHEAITEEEVRVGQAAKARGESTDPMLQRMKAEVAAGQKELAGMPKDLQDRLSGMDAFELKKLRAVITNPAGGTSQQRLEAYHGLLKEGARLEPREFLQMLDQARPGVVAHEEGLAAQRKQVRGALSVHLEDSAKGALKGLELEDLANLPPEHVQAAGKMIASGQYDERAGAELFLAARAKSTALTEKEFTAKLKGAVDAVTTTRKMEKEAAEARREAVLGPKKDEAHAALSGLDDDGIRLVKHLMDAGAEGSPMLKEHLYQQAAKGTPGLDKETFLKGLGTVVKRAAEERNVARRAARIERAERLGEYPPHVRGPLSALPEEALFQLRLAAARGEEISPQLRQQLHDAALRETPTGKVNLAKLDAAIDEAVKRPTLALETVEGEKLRAELTAAVPTELRSKIQDVPILVMRAEDFVALTGSRTGQAVTLLVEGKPVVVVREGASPKVLREEGLHALQAQDARWREHVGRLNEAKLANWKNLPLEEQLQIYRSKVELEIDAQLNVKRSLEAELESAAEGEREDLALRLAKAEAALDNLARRFNEVESITPGQKRAVELGLKGRDELVPYLDQPARLFNKDETGEPQVSEALLQLGKGKKKREIPEVTLVQAGQEQSHDGRFQVAKIVGQLPEGEQLRLVRYDAEGKARFQVIALDDPDPVNPTKPPPYLLVLKDGKFVLRPNKEGYPPVQAHQDVHYVEGPGGEISVQPWNMRKANAWKVEQLPGGGFKLVYEVPFTRAPVKEGEVTPVKPEPLPETVQQRIDRLTGASDSGDPQRGTPRGVLATYFREEYLSFRPVQELGVESDVVVNGKRQDLDLADLGAALVKAKIGELPPDREAQLLGLARKMGLITDDLTFSSGKDVPLKTAEGEPPRTAPFLDALENPHFKALVRQHLVHILSTHPDYQGSPHAFVKQLAELKLLGEQHSHLDANITVEFLISQGDRGMESLAKALNSEVMLKSLQQLDIISSGGMVQHGQEEAPIGRRSVRDLAEEVIAAYARYKSETRAVLRKEASVAVQEALHAFMDGLAIHRHMDVQLAGGMLNLGTTDRFFQAYTAMQQALLGAVGEVDADVAAKLLGMRKSAGSLAMEEIRFGARGRAGVEKLLREVGTAGVQRGFIMAISKNEGFRNLGGDSADRDAKSLRQLVKDFFTKAGNKSLRGLIGLDSSGKEGQSPIVHAREFTLRSLHNLEQSMGRLEDANLRQQLILHLEAAGEEKLASWVRSLGDKSTDKVFQAIKAHHEVEEGKLNTRLGGKEKIEAFTDFLGTRYGGDPGDPGSGLALGELAHLNRLAVDLIRRRGLMGTGEGRLKQLGLTVHTGEQLLIRKPFALLGDVKMAMALGSDRLGHALILGVTGETLERMGLLSREQVADFNDQRKAVIKDVERLGLTVELNITSNMVISNINLEVHAAAELAKAGVRVSVSTDDEALLHTSVVEELHRYAQVKGVGMPKVVEAALEAFASRLGTWELQGARDLKDDWTKQLLMIRPQSVQDATIDAVIRRFLGPKAADLAKNDPKLVGPLLKEALDYIFEPTPEETKTAPVVKPQEKKTTPKIEPEETKKTTPEVTPEAKKTAPMVKPEDMGPVKLVPFKGKINVGGGLEEGAEEATNLNPIKPGSGGPEKDIPNHVKAGFEEIGELFEPGSVKQLYSNRLRYVDVDWKAAAQGATKVMAKGGEISLNIWTSSDAEAHEVAEEFRRVGFKDVKVWGNEAGILVMGKWP